VGATELGVPRVIAGDWECDSITPQLYRQCSRARRALPAFQTALSLKNGIFLQLAHDWAGRTTHFASTGAQSSAGGEKASAKFPARKTSHPGSGTVQPQLHCSIRIPAWTLSEQSWDPVAQIFKVYDSSQKSGQSIAASDIAILGWSVHFKRWLLV